MQWIATSEKDTGNALLEKSLLGTADQLPANSGKKFLAAGRGIAVREFPTKPGFGFPD